MALSISKKEKWLDRTFRMCLLHLSLENAILETDNQKI